MPIKDSNVRLVITIPKTTLETLNALERNVYKGESKSKIINEAINCFAVAVVEGLNNAIKNIEKEEKENVKKC